MVEIPVFMTEAERRFLPQLESFLSQGVGADRAFRLLREFRGITGRAVSPIRRSVVRAISRVFRQNIREQRALLPQGRSVRLKADMAIGTNFRSPLNFRWLVDFEFTVVNTLTGERRTVRNRIGTRRLGRIGEFLDEARSRVEQFNVRDDDRYISQFEIADVDSIRIVGLFRTLNR